MKSFFYEKLLKNADASVSLSATTDASAVRYMRSSRLVKIIFLAIFGLSVPVYSQGQWTFDTTSWSVVKENSWIDTLILFQDLPSGDRVYDTNVFNEYGYQYQGISDGYHQYRLSYEYPDLGKDLRNFYYEGNIGFLGTAVSMHHNTQIDMRKDWIFSARLNFGGIEIPRGGFGFVFYLHRNAKGVGGYGANMGYGSHWLGPTDRIIYYGFNGMGPIKPPHVTPIVMSSSAAVLFSSNSLYFSRSQFNGLDVDIIAYLQDANMYSDSNYNAVRMRQDGSSVTDSLWHCIDIAWIRRSDGKFDLVTYFEGQERIRRTYNTISDLVSSASDITPYVTFAISTGLKACRNTHLIQYISMLNSDSLFSTFYSGLISGDGFTMPRDTFAIGGLSRINCGVVYGSDGDSSLGKSTTNPIKYSHIPCYNMARQIIITIDKVESADWHVKVGNDWIHQEYQKGGSLFLNFIIDARPKNKGQDTILVRFINRLTNDSLYFQVVYVSQQTQLKNYLDSTLFNKSGYNILPLNNNKLKDTIQLPTTNGCHYSVFNYEPSAFIIEPYINPTTNKLIFQLEYIATKYLKNNNIVIF